MATIQKKIGDDKFPNTLYQNVSSDQIQITEDKLRLKLEVFEKSAKKSNEWLSWGGLFLTAFTAWGTSNFDYKYGISGETWSSIFGLVSIISFVMLLVSPIVYC